MSPLIRKPPVVLAGAHAVVTGASRSIGAALARELAGRGARVTVVARSEGPLKNVAAEIGGTAVVADLTDPDDVAGLVARIEAEAGPVDVLVNNAAMAVVERFADQSPSDITGSYALNVVAPMELCRQVLPGMLERGRGAVVSISSLCGVTAFPTLATYGSTKAALVHFTATLQRELSRSPVHAVVVQFGEVAGTEMMEQARKSPTVAAVSKRLARTGALVVLTPEQAAAAVVEGIAAGRRDILVPRRIGPLHHIRELPSRINDLILLGIE
jgi:short-subunit dehydrogenase